jgi:hypothetical protein
MRTLRSIQKEEIFQQNVEWVKGVLQTINQFKAMGVRFAAGIALQRGEGQTAFRP